jgi:hypothetical protein
MGTLTVTMLDDDEIYQGTAEVMAHQRSRDYTHSTLIVFEMERDDPMEYTPDPLPSLRIEDGLPTLNRCSDCDATLEQRSMPDGIEEWCPVCNVQLDKESRERQEISNKLGSGKVISWEAENKVTFGMFMIEKDASG